MLYNGLQVPSLISFLQQIASKDPQQEGLPLHELRPHMLLPAATLPVNAEQFQGLLEQWKPLQCLAVFGKIDRVEISCMRCQFQIQLTA